MRKVPLGYSRVGFQNAKYGVALRYFTNGRSHDIFA